MQGDRMSKPIVKRFAHFALAAFAGSALAQGASAPAAAPEGHVVGIAFVGRLVADLDDSVAFYKTLGLEQDMRANPVWRKDEFTERLYGLKGMETRMAKMLAKSSFSGKDFAVYLREIRGIPRRKVSGSYPPWEPGAPHFGLVVPDAPALWAQLEERDAEGALLGWEAHSLPRRDPRRAGLHDRSGRSRYRDHQ